MEGCILLLYRNYIANSGNGQELVIFFVDQTTQCYCIVVLDPKQWASHTSVLCAIYYMHTPGRAVQYKLAFLQSSTRPFYCKLFLVLSLCFLSWVLYAFISLWATLESRIFLVQMWAYLSIVTLEEIVLMEHCCSKLALKNLWYPVHALGDIQYCSAERTSRAFSSCIISWGNIQSCTTLNGPCLTEHLWFLFLRNIFKIFTSYYRWRGMP